MTKPLSFQSFIQTYFSWFKFDQQCHEIIKRMGQYACRDEAFTKNVPTQWVFEVDGHVIQSSLRLRKGLLVFGNVGTGKTELFRMLNYYNRYLQSPYTFASTKVWKLADQFREKGNEAFNLFGKNNYYFDELCMTDESGFPSREFVMTYGNKTLIGEKLITERSEAFKDKGWVTHFTTNVPLPELKRIYGERAFSRLVEMCNFIPLIGVDRRLDSDPIFINDFNQPVFTPTPTRDEDFDAETRSILDKKLSTYLLTGDVKVFTALDFHALQRLGIQVCDDAALVEQFKAPAISSRRCQISMNGFSLKEHNRLMKMYEEERFDYGEQAEIMNVAKHIAIVQFANALKQMGRTSFFN